MHAGLLVALCLPSFSQQHLNREIATWEAKFEFDYELYSSFVLMLSGPRANVELPAEYIGNPTGIAEARKAGINAIPRPGR
jgi:hypothetical protein